MDLEYCKLITEYSGSTTSFMNGIRSLALVPRCTKIVWFKSYPCWITFRKKRFQTNGGSLHFHCDFFFKSKQDMQVHVKNRIDAPKENQGFFDWEMHVRPRCWIDIHHCVANKILASFSEKNSYFGEKKMAASVFHLYPAFSTRHCVFQHLNLLF